MLQPHQQRVVDEKHELDTRILKLRCFLLTPIFQSLDAAEQKRLERQAVAMGGYSQILSERINAFNAQNKETDA